MVLFQLDGQLLYRRGRSVQFVHPIPNSVKTRRANIASSGVTHKSLPDPSPSPSR